MGIYDDPYGGYEPTDEDYCAMEGHPTAPDPQDPDGGWETCYCRHVVESPFGEPHDEYSALHAELRDKYVSAILSAPIPEFRGNPPTNELVKKAFTLHRMLSDFSIDDLRELLEITKDSSPILFDRNKDPREVLVIGTHLDHNGDTIISSIVRDLTRDEISKYDHRLWIIGNYQNSLTDPEHLRIARVSAKFYGKLTHSEEMYMSHERSDIVSLITCLSDALSRNPEKMDEVAALVNAKGVSEATTQLALAVLNGEIEAVVPSLGAGLL